MEAFKPQTAEEWDALIKGTTQPYVKSLIIEAHAKSTSHSKDIIEGVLLYSPPLNEVWGTPLEDEEIIWEKSRSTPLIDAKPIIDAKPLIEAKPISLPVEQGEFEDIEDYFNRIASFYDEGKRGKQDPNIEYAFDHIMERNLKQSFSKGLDQLSDTATRPQYRLQFYYSK